jgi:thiol-disulfide isomerase/thioredoxin
MKNIKTLLLSLLLVGFLTSCGKTPEQFDASYTQFVNSFDAAYKNVKTKAVYDSLMQWAYDTSLVILNDYQNLALEGEQLSQKARLLAFSKEDSLAIEAYDKALQTIDKPDDKVLSRYFSLLLEHRIQTPEQRKNLFALMSQYKASMTPQNWFKQMQGYGFVLTEKMHVQDALMAHALVYSETKMESQYAMSVLDASSLINDSRGKDAALTFLDSKLAKYPENGMLNRHRTQLALLNTKAPELDFSKWFGNEFSLKSLRGKVVMLDFWAPWCGPCRRAFPEMKNLYREFADGNFEIIGVTNYYDDYRDDQKRVPNISPADYDQELVAFIDRFQLPWPVMISKNTTKSGQRDMAINRANYGVSFIPTFFLIDKKGVVRYAQVGTRENRDVLMNKIAALLAE